MNGRRKDEDDPGRIHDEMLRHLEENPPPKRPARPQPPSPAPSPAPPRPPQPPTLMLRRLRYEMAMDRLERFVRLHGQRGTETVLIVVGKGRSSPHGEPVLAPAVRRWLQAQPGVRSVETAPADAGGEGALLVRLKT